MSDEIKEETAPTKVLTPKELQDFKDATQGLEEAKYAYGKAKYAHMISEQQLANAEEAIRDQDRAYNTIVNRLKNKYKTETLFVDAETGELK